MIVKGSARLLTNPRMRFASARSSGCNTTSSIIFFYTHNDSLVRPKSASISRDFTLLADSGTCGC